jgi:hypothetical protein
LNKLDLFFAKDRNMLGKLLSLGRNEEWVDPDPEEDTEELEWSRLWFFQFLKS